MSEEKTTAEIVSCAFVKQYYHTLNESPQFLHMFYKDPCLFNRFCPLTNVKKTVWTREEVKDEFRATKFENFTAEIETSLGIPYPMEHGCVIVFVNGYLTSKKDNVRNKFTQTFLLALQDNSFYIVNDIFRYKKGRQTPTRFLAKTESRSRSKSESVALRQPLPCELTATESSISLSGKAPSKGEDNDEWFMVLGF